MHSFVFRLEKVLRWRETQLELEQLALGRAAAECASWDAVLARLDRSRAEAETLVHHSVSVPGRELEALARYKERLRTEKRASLEQRLLSEQRMEQQRGRVLAARREYRLLDKLRHLRRKEWEAAVDREFEALAAESFLAQWTPRPRRGAGDELAARSRAVPARDPGVR